MIFGDFQRHSTSRREVVGLSEPHCSCWDARSGLVTRWCSETGNVGIAKVALVYHLPWTSERGTVNSYVGTKA